MNVITIPAATTGGRPADGPRQWWRVTLQADQGATVMRVHCADQDTAVALACGHELAPPSAVLSIAAEEAP